MSALKPVTKLLIVLMLPVIAACTPSYELDSDIVNQAQVVNLATPEQKVLASGQPTEDQFRLLAEAGVRHVINLRPASEQDWDEGAFVQSLNMEYHSIPVAGAAGVTRENAASLYQLLADLEGEPVVVHCASGNRVGALIAYSSVEFDGLGIDAAIAEGQRWGLTRMEPTVREILSQN
jgi:uncharacterized protein (TIGR01244 family)